ncbi:MAG TPA: integrin alpha, partial [Myxococcota bacterium]|nr:integrin alpha [Myxococcota bacterium]
GGAPYGGARGPAFYLTPTQAHGWFGYSVAGGRDFDGDGSTDLAISAIREWVPDPTTFALRQDTGAVYVFFGPFSGADLTAGDAGLVIQGPSESGFFGTGLAFVRDMDGDGLAELAIGASTANVGQIGRGAVWLIPSAAGLTGREYVADLPTLELYSSALSADFGGSVAEIGNFDGAAGWELAMSASHTAQASVYVLGDVRGFYLANGPSSHDVADVAARYQGLVNNGEAVGRSLAGGADLDEDGLTDLVLGMVMHREAGQFVGGAAIVPGRAGGAAPGATFDLHAVGVMYPGAVSNDLMVGASVALPGDLNGDGHEDVAVGSPGDSVYSGGGGAVWVRLGDGTLPAPGSTLPITDWDLVAGSGATHAFGAAVVGSRNLDGDPEDDLAVGYHDVATSACAVWAF